MLIRRFLYVDVCCDYIKARSLRWLNSFVFSSCKAVLLRDYNGPPCNVLSVQPISPCSVAGRSDFHANFFHPVLHSTSRHITIVPAPISNALPMVQILTAQLILQTVSYSNPIGPTRFSLVEEGMRV